MNISIRIKFFVILIAFSLGPMLISRTLMSGHIQEESHKLTVSTNAELLHIVSAELEHNAISLLDLLEARGQVSTLAVRMLAKQAEHLLNYEKPQDHGKPYFASNFTHGGDAPPDLFKSEYYLRRPMSGSLRQMSISLEHPSFRLPIERGARSKEEISSLIGLTPTFKELYTQSSDGTNWYNVGLKSGTFVTYPGHGYFPMHYDHRMQDWYRKARGLGDDKETVWTVPVIDPSSRLAVITVSSPIKSTQGEFLGAASLDVPISSIMNEVSLKSRWSAEIESFMVKYLPADDKNDESLLVLANQTYDDEHRRHWMAGIEPEYLTPGTDEGFKSLVNAMNSSSNGIIRLPYQGKDCVWAYASNDDFSFLLIVPETIVTELPDQMSGAVDMLIADIRNISAIVSGVMLIITGFIAWFGSSAVTKPLLVMADAAKRLAKGDFSVRMGMRTGDERDQLIDSFNDMVPKLQERLHLRRDMELAHQVQQLLLPRNEPDIAGYDISGGILFCDQTGGDYYDFIEMQGAKGKALGVVLGDVSGHGVPSALLMATARGQLHSLSKAPLGPRERIAAINNVLSRDMDGTGRFLTLFYLRLDEYSSTVTWVRAGHDPAMRYTPETREFSELGGDGLALGVLEDFVFQDYSTTLTPGEVLVLATDGVWESRNTEGEMFGKKRMLAIIKESAHKSAEGIRLSLVKAVEDYQGNGQEDDMAIVVIKKD